MENFEHKKQHHDHDHDHDQELKNDPFKIVLFILVVLLIATNAFTAYYLFTKKNNSLPSTLNQNTNIDQNTNINTNTNTNESENDENTTEENTEDTTKVGQNEIYIDWQNEITPISASAIFDVDSVQTYLDSERSYYPLENSQDFYDWAKVYKTGTVKISDDGKYKDANIYLLYTLYEGPGFGNNISRFIEKNNKLYLLEKYSSLSNDNTPGLFDYADKNTTITNISTPESFDVPNSNIKLKKVNSAPLTQLETFVGSEYSDAKVLFTEDNYKVYQAYNCIISANTEGTIYYYIYDLDFDYDKEPSRNAQPLDITWTNGIKNTDSFFLYNRYTMIGSSCYAFGDTYNISDLSKLKIAGTTPSGDKIYELKDANIKNNPQDEISILQSFYNQYYVPDTEEKISFEDYVASHPLIFWQDPFGNFIAIENSTYGRAVEMGKPVIYLYPEKTTDVAVHVYPNQGLTITEPNYKNGWFVKAYPDGTLYNYADKNTYPYLFWEGLGIDYSIPKQGFVVAKKDIKKFLADALAKQGLLPKEYNEFIDFWAPKMEEKPYYFITFIPQAEFDKLAPLDINPKPDTTIRVFMDYKGLDKKINVEPQILSTPDRQGFVVVEWGGALR